MINNNVIHDKIHYNYRVGRALAHQIKLPDFGIGVESAQLNTFFGHSVTATVTNNCLSSACKKVPPICHYSIVVVFQNLYRG
jgi:hypothetical protein